LLTTLLLLQTGYAYVPYSSLESVIERNKESYYLALRRTQGALKSDNPDFTPWLIFFLRGLQKQKVHLESKVESEQHLYLPELSSHILQYIREHGRMTIGNMVDFSQANRNTLKKHLAELVKDRYILKHGKGRATWYTLH
jgi:Fic family protein